MTLNIANLANAQAMGWADAPITRNAAGRVGVPALNVAQGTVTTDLSAIDLSATWNNAAITFEAIKANITDTASNAASLLMDLQVGGVSRTRVVKNGILQLENSGVVMQFDPVGGTISMLVSGSRRFETSQYGHLMLDSASLGWSTSGTSVATIDTRLFRDGAGGQIAQRNGVNPQTFRVYNTFTDTLNYERGFMRWVSNELQIGAEAGGTGTLRGMRLECSQLSVRVNGVDRYQFGVGGFFAAQDGVGLGNTVSVPHAALRANGSGIALLNGSSSSTAGGALEMIEMTAPAAPAANRVRIFTQDNGAGKTQLMALFPTGVAQQIAIEP